MLQPPDIFRHLGLGLPESTRPPLFMHDYGILRLHIHYSSAPKLLGYIFCFLSHIYISGGMPLFRVLYFYLFFILTLLFIFFVYFPWPIYTVAMEGMEGGGLLKSRMRRRRMPA
ncbi:hypothetical protein GGI42DRAFT_199138 [Trichoderma sp. SZMC 28013]